MLFNSYQFIFLFLPITFFVFFAIGGRRPVYAAAWLTLASLFFYGWWNPVYVLKASKILTSRSSGPLAGATLRRRGKGGAGCAFESRPAALAATASDPKTLGRLNCQAKG